MLAASPEADLVTKEQITPFLQHLPVPHVCEDTTLQLLCTARSHNHHHCKAHFLTRLLASRTQPVPATTTMGIAAAHFDCPSFFSYSPRTNGAVSSTCKAEECVVTLHTTRGLRTGCACSQAHTCVCEHATQLPRLHLASSTHHSSSRGPADLAALQEEAHPQCSTSPTCVWRRVTGPLPSIAGTKRRGIEPSHASMDIPFLSFTKCVWHIGCKGPLHTALCCAPLSVLHSRLSWSMQPHQHRQQQMRMRLSPLLARVTAASAADACARQQADRSHCH